MYKTCILYFIIWFLKNRTLRICYLKLKSTSFGRLFATNSTILQTFEFALDSLKFFCFFRKPKKKLWFYRFISNAYFFFTRVFPIVPCVLLRITGFGFAASVSVESDFVIFSCFFVLESFETPKFFIRFRIEGDDLCGDESLPASSLGGTA